MALFRKLILLPFCWTLHLENDTATSEKSIPAGFCKLRCRWCLFQRKLCIHKCAKLLRKILLHEGCPVLPTGVQTVRRIPWTSRDPSLVSPQTQAPILSGGSFGHPGILPWFLLRHRLHESFVVGVFVGDIRYRVAVKKDSMVVEHLRNI